MKNIVDRQKDIDVVKGVGIILMVIGHTDSPFTKVIYGFHMPLFFIISGYLYNINKWNKLGIKQLAEKRFRDYIIPYFILGAINLFLNAVSEFLNMGFSIELLLSTIKHGFWIIYSYGSINKMPNCTPLWFLPALFISYLYFYTIIKKNLRCQILLCICYTILYRILINFITIQFPWHMETALIGAVMMYFGMLLKKFNFIKRCSVSIILLVMTIGLIGIKFNSRVDMNPNRVGNYILFWIGALGVSIGILYLGVKYLKNIKFLSFLGQNTILIIGFNYFFNTLIKNIWPLVTRIIHYNWFLASVISLTMNVLFIIVCKKLKLLQFNNYT